MKIPKIIIGQINSVLTDHLAEGIAAGEFEIHVAEHGDRVIELVRLGLSPDLVVLSHELAEPGALDVCRWIKADAARAMTPVLLIAPGSTEEEQRLAVDAGFDDVLADHFTAPVLLARIQSLVRLKFVSEQWEDGETVLYTLARTIEAKDPYTLGHADRVAQFAVQLGQAMGVSAADSETLRKGGMLHDIGKIAVPDSILLKPGRLSPEEFAVMKRHPVLGCEICEKLRSVREALPLIRHHHERLDGTGYPDGLKAEKIPPLVRVVAIVDIYDALRSQRTYKEAFSLDTSLSILWTEVDKGWWDKDILTAWEKLVRSSGIKSSAA